MMYEDDYGCTYVYDDFAPIEFIARKSPMTEKHFHNGYNTFATLDEAIKDSSRRASKQQLDVTIYQAVKKVSPKAPEVDVSDITVSA